MASPLLERASLLVLASVGTILAFAPVSGHAQESANTFSFEFEDDNDLNYDRWPDDWTRRSGPGFPHYIDIGIRPREDGDGNCLSIQLDGGAAEIASPPQKIDSRFSYYLTFELRTFESSEAEENEAWVSVQFLDEDRRSLVRYQSPPMHHVSEFQQVRIGPMIPPDVRNGYAVVRLHTRPTRTTDLFGGAQFDKIRLLASPKLLITANQPYNIFPATIAPEITCRVSGVQDEEASLVFQLFNAEGEPVGEPETRSLIDSLVALEGNQPPSVSELDRDNYRSLLDEMVEDPGDYDLNREITVDWEPPVNGLGFYRLHIDLKIGDEPRMTRDLTLAVVDTDYQISDSHFGWTMPLQDTSTSLPQLTEMIRQSGVRWVKYPVWYARTDNASAEWIAEFAERLAGQEIELVGILDEPPEEHLDSFSQTEQGIAALLREPDSWPPAVNHVLTRLSLKVHRWQIGADNDPTLIGYPDLYERLTQVREKLSRYAKDMQVGIPWNWLHFVPHGNTLPWDFSVLLSDPVLTERELVDYLALDEQHSENVWAVIQPLPRDGYSLQTRVKDLVWRMMRVKLANAKGFVVEPFSDRHGLLREDGSPSELWVPWRTTSFQLAGKQFLGSLQLPNGSENYVFEDGETATMLVWNEDATNEEIYLGENPVITNIWGRRIQLEKNGHRHVVPVTDWPIFVSGLDLDVAKFRINFNFKRDTLASVFGQRQQAGIRALNVFPKGASGQVSIVNDNLWARQINFGFKASAGESFEREFPVILQPFASTGLHPVRIDVAIDTDKSYEFSVYRDLQIGYGLVELEYRLVETDSGVIVVHATLINNSFNLINFDCMLLVPGQRRQRQQIHRLGHGRETVEFFISQNADLDSEPIWLRAEELRGNRVLNEQFYLSNGVESVAPE